TPPRLVEKATAYGPGASQRIRSRSLIGDQLPRGIQLRLAAVEPAAQLAAAELLEHLPHARRLGQAELREVAAVELEPDVAEAGEPVPDGRRVALGERDQRALGGPPREVHDLDGVGGARKAWGERDGGLDRPLVLPAQREALEELRVLADDQREAEAPARRARIELVAQGICARDDVRVHRDTGEIGE